MASKATLVQPVVHLSNTCNGNLSLTPTLSSSQKLSSYVFKYIAWFLPKDDVCNSLKVCKSWNRSIDDPSTWKRLMGIDKATHRVVQENILAGKRSIREIVWGPVPENILAGNCSIREMGLQKPGALVFSKANEENLSNCFVIPETNQDGVLKYSVYGLEGRFISTLTLHPFTPPDGFKPAVTYATEQAIVVIFRNNETRRNDTSFFVTCAIFSKETGDFLRSFKLVDRPKSKVLEGGPDLDVLRIAAILEKPDRLVFYHQTHSFYTFDLEGNLISNHAVKSNPHYFSKETRSIFHSQDGAICEIALEGGQKKRYPPPKWTQVAGKEKSSIDRINANSQLLSAYSNYCNKIAVWDYKTGKGLALFPFPFGSLSQLSLIGSHILFGVPTNRFSYDFSEYYLYDGMGNLLFTLPLGERSQEQAQLLPFRNLFLYSSDDFSKVRKNPTWNLHDSQGNMLREFQVLPREFSGTAGHCYVTPTCLCFRYADRAVIHDFGTKQSKEPQDKSADKAVLLKSHQADACCIIA